MGTVHFAFLSQNFADLKLELGLYTVTGLQWHASPLRVWSLDSPLFPWSNDGDGIERLCWNSIIPPQNNMELGTGVQALHLTL